MCKLVCCTQYAQIKFCQNNWKVCTHEYYDSYLSTYDFSVWIQKGLALFKCNSCSQITLHVICHGFCHMCQRIRFGHVKSFDKVNHYALFNKQINIQVPSEMLTTFITW